KFQAAYDAARDPAQRAMMDIEYRVLPVGSTPMRWIKVRGRGVFDENGACLRVSGTALEITAERETRDALTHSEELLRLAADNAEIGMWDMDVIRNVNYSQPRVKAMFGMLPDEDPPPEEFFNLVHKEDVDRVLAAYGDAFDPVKRGTYDVAYRVNG